MPEGRPGPPAPVRRSARVASKMQANNGGRIDKDGSPDDTVELVSAGAADAADEGEGEGKGDGEGHLRLVTYNLQCGIGADRVYNPERMASWFASLNPTPDIIALQEADRNKDMVRNTRTGVAHADDHVGLVARALGWVESNSHFVVKKHARLKSNGKWESWAARPDDRWGWGVALLSRFPIVERATIEIPEHRSFGKKHSASLACGILVEPPGLGRTWVFSAHYKADVFGAATLSLCGSAQLHSTETILEWIEERVGVSGTDNVIFCGDLNEVLASKSIQTFLTHKGNWGPFVDCAFELQRRAQPSGWFIFPAGTIPSIGWYGGILRLDYVLMSSKSRKLDVKSTYVAHVGHSDHRPVIVDFNSKRTPQATYWHRALCCSRVLACAGVTAVCFLLCLLLGGLFV